MSTENATVEYQIRLDRGACEGIFACLARDDRFVEAGDGLATIEDTDESDEDTLTAAFADDRIEDARAAACACPVGAIEVCEVADE
jgi:ferredoxin